MTYKLLLHDTVVLSQPLLIKEFGEKGARLLSQIHYWLLNPDNPGKIHEDHKWVYNNEKEWANQVVCSTRTLRRQVDKLCKANIIFKAQLSENQSDRTNYFRINYEELYKIWPETRSFVHEDKVTRSSGQSDLFLIRTETTTKNFNNNNFKNKKNVYKDEIPPSCKVEKMIEELNEPKALKAIRLNILQKVGVGPYRSYFHGAKFLAKDDKLHLVTSVYGAQEQWDMHYGMIPRVYERPL